MAAEAAVESTRRGNDTHAADDASAAPLRATQVCLDRLQAAQSALRRHRSEATSASSAAPACLDDPEVTRIIERRIDDAIVDHVGAQRERRREARERERSAFSTWSTEVLELTVDEQQWLEDYVCTAREPREQTLASLEDTPPTEALEELKRQRSELLGDMKAALGPERYATLRTIGGIGLLADTTDCS
jgi:hypothetical protein